jgi:RNA polymerase sigma-70 factor (ECF subfamily)
VNGDVRTLPDGDLAALGDAGGQAAFAEIMRRHAPSIFRLIRSCTGDAEEALDLTQDTFVAAHRALARYDRVRPLRTWLAAIALNKCRDWGRKRAVRRFLTFAGPIDDAAAAIADDRPSVEDGAADRQELRRVARMIAALPTALKETLILRTIEGMSQSETAAVLSISEKAVETRLHRARKALSDRLHRG